MDGALFSLEVFDPYVDDAPQPMIPLFLGYGAVSEVNAAFVSLVGPGYSSYPVVCGTKMLRNCYFALAVLDKDRAGAKVQERAPLEAIIAEKLDSDNFCSYADFKRKDHDTVTIYGLTKEHGHSDILKIIRDVLNPLGIGAFYEGQFVADGPRSVFSVFPFRGPVRARGQYVPVAYSEEMVEQILLEHEGEDDDLDAFNVAALVSLKFPVNPIVLPRVDLKRRRDRFVFFKMMLQNPPLRHGKEGSLQSNMKVDAYQWVWIHWKNAPGNAKAVICSKGPDDPLVNLLEDNVPDDYRVECPFVGGDAALMHPKGGKLIITGKHTGVKVWMS